MKELSPQEAYGKTLNYSRIIAWLRVLNNLLGLISVVVFAYLVWWVWGSGWLGIFPFFILIWIFNSFILPLVFGGLQGSLAEKAKWSLISLADHGVISHKFANELLSKPVEYWSNHINRGISNEGVRILKSDSDIALENSSK